MKGPTCLILAVFLAYCEQVCTQEKAQDVPDGPIVRSCRAEYPISRDSLRQILSHVAIPNDRTAMCFLSCASKKAGAIQNGTVNWETSAKLMKSFWGSQKHFEKIDKVIELCKNEFKTKKFKAEDDCDLAYEMSICKKAHGDELGLPHLKFNRGRKMNSARIQLDNFYSLTL